MHPRLTIVFLCTAALLAGVYLQLFGFSIPGKMSEPDRPQIEGFMWPEQKQLAEFAMVNQDGGPFALENLAGKWNFLFFGYTHCPDICPVTMNTLRGVRDTLLKDHALDPDNVGFVFVSVDGERDTPEHLKSYISFFGEQFAGATGTKNQVDSLTTQLGVPYEVDEHEPGSTDYLVAHSGSIFLISPEATLASVFHPPHSPTEIADLFARINRFMAEQS